jgi:hypothetical protein
MDRSAVRRFVFADRDAVDALRRKHWAQLYRERGPEAAWQVAQALRAHMQAVRPDWPTAADRDDDLRHHVALKRQLERTRHVLSRH